MITKEDKQVIEAIVDVLDGQPFEKALTYLARTMASYISVGIRRESQAKIIDYIAETIKGDLRNRNNEKEA